jgi:ligand-binding sensor domain-containing protein/signal transduction histidine kinase
MQLRIKFAAFLRTEQALSRCICRIILITIFIVKCAPASALNPTYNLSQYIHSSWGNASKLQVVRRVAQTPDGYLWLATSGGLVRFDGVRFTTYNRTPEQGLDNLADLWVDADGSLWFANLLGGVVAHFESGRFHTYNSRDGLPPGDIQTLYRDSRGVLWVGTRRDGVFRMVHGRFEKVPLPIPSGNVTRFLEDSDDALWIATYGDGVLRLRDGNLGVFSVKDGLPDSRVLSLCRARSGRIWTASGKGVSFWNGIRFESDQVINSAVGHASGCIEDREGVLWITSSSGVYQSRMGQLTRMDAASGLTADFALDVYEDKEGNVWVATNSGLDRFRDAQIRTFTKREGLLPETGASKRPIIADGRAGVWTVSGKHIARIVGDGITSSQTSLPSSETSYTMLSESDSGFLVGFDSGLEHWSPTHAMFAAETAGLDVRGLFRARDGSVWIGTANRGLLHWKSSPGSPSRLDPINPDRFITGLAEDQDGTIWAGSHGGGLYRITGPNVQHFGRSEGLPSSDIFTVFVDRKGVLWIGSAGGLSWFQDGRIRTVNSQQGLRSDLVLTLMDDAYGRLWLLGYAGIAAIEQESLKEWTAGRRIKLNPTYYRSANGMTIETGDRHFPNAAESTDGHIWFAVEDGLAEVTPPKATGSPVPPFRVLIEDVTIDSVSHPVLGPVRITAGARSMELRYTALTLSDSEAVRFRFRLEGFDNDWVEADTRRTAFYSNLKPGVYRFRVAASAGGERWQESSALALEQLPIFYQTRWFLLLMAAIVLSLFFLTYRLRLHLAVSRIKGDFEQRIDERTRIARELHDTLLQSFQGAVFLFQASRKLLLRNADNAMQVIDEAIQAAEEGITQGRAAIHDLRPEPAAQRDLPALLKATGRELADTQRRNGNAPTFEVIVEGKQQDLSPMLHDEVYRIAREVIRNAFAHALAGHIEVEIRYDQDQLRVRIRDDGKGIDPKILEDGGQAGHWGIPGMRERARRIGSQLDFWSEIGAGAEVQLTIPASIAYEKRRHYRRFRLFQGR